MKTPVTKENEIIHYFHILKDKSEVNIAKIVNVSTSTVTKILNNYLHNKKFNIYQSKMNYE